MGPKSLMVAAVVAGLPVTLANNVGYQAHCEIKPSQCRQNAPDPIHTHGSQVPYVLGTRTDVPVSLLGTNTTITPNTGSMSTFVSGGPQLYQNLQPRVWSPT
jgi:hypothetical protein